MTLTNGTRVESSVPTFGETAGSLDGRTYRVLQPDGAVTVFATLAPVLHHLRDHYAVDGHRTANRP